MDEMRQVALILPQEVWVNIFGYLSSSDLFQLRLSCKDFNRIVSSDAVWKPRCYTRWLDHLSHDPFYDEVVSCDHDWFYYYRFRNRIDQSLMKLLQRITKECDSEEYWHLRRLIIRYNPSHVIPLLNKIVNGGSVLGSDPFDVVTLSRHSLSSLRHKHVYDLFSVVEKSSQTFVHNAEETFFLPLSAMDPAFDRLLHCRSETYDSVRALVKAEFNDIRDFLTLPTTLRVDKLISYLFETLSLLDKKRQLYLEDFMLLRIYAGETAGHPLLILSMVQSLASNYNVETVLCGSYLIIHDPRVRDRETYLTISSTGIPKIFTKKRLVQSFKRILGSSDYIIQSEILPTILQPLKYKDLLATIFKEILPLYNKSKWSVVVPKTVNELERLFPCSGQPVNPEAVNYFLCVFKAVETHSKFERSISVLSTVTFREVFRLVAKLFPGDLAYAEELFKCRGADFCATEYAYQDWLSQIHNIIVQNHPQLGRFVTSLRDQEVMCVMGINEHHIGETFQVLMSFAGEFYVENSSNTKPLEREGEGSLIKKFLAAASQSDLGLVFSGIDWKSNKMIPNCQVHHILQYN